MNTEQPNVVVVGTDGSPSSEVAALWAAAEAQRRGATLQIVHAYSVPMIFYGPGARPEGINHAAGQGAAAILARIDAVITSTYPQLEVTTLARETTPVDALRTASEYAALTVVGSHGSHQITETLLGSVAARLSGHAHSPVVIIRSNPARLPPEAGDGPIVVGLDGSPESDDALAFALDEAAVRGTSLVAIRVWDTTPLDGFQQSYPLPLDMNKVDDNEGRLLAEQLQTWTEKYPAVPIRPLVLRGRPWAALLRFCESPDPAGRPSLLVVGTRGRGGFAGMMLGSTSHAIIARASGAVAVVRPDSHADQ